MHYRTPHFYHWRDGAITGVRMTACTRHGGNALCCGRRTPPLFGSVGKGGGGGIQPGFGRRSFWQDKTGGDLNGLVLRNRVSLAGSAGLGRPQEARSTPSLYKLVFLGGQIYVLGFCSQATIIQHTATIIPRVRNS